MQRKINGRRIIGNIDETTKKLLLEKGIEYSCNSNLTHRQIVDEYCKADIINFPSLFEGFGMPIIEGQAIGRVVVTSNIPPMIDIAGDLITLRVFSRISYKCVYHENRVTHARHTPPE